LHELIVLGKLGKRIS